MKDGSQPRMHPVNFCHRSKCIFYFLINLFFTFLVHFSEYYMDLDDVFRWLVSMSEYNLMQILINIWMMNLEDLGVLTELKGTVGP